ncbi:MAG: glutamate 5-kinase [Clostridiales Family XIII bacterium]|jgi:glutamate 5-kinase|nr:glutamate 5-kinase [Clostridiales Family XIII bacterium]
MGKASSILKESRKIVLKIGSNVLTGSDGHLDGNVIANITDQVVALMREGKQIIIVSSGAEISGVTALGLKSRHGDINFKQALCAIGQVELMLAYKKYFTAAGYVIGQLLLTREDFEKHNSSIHIRNTLFTLLDEGVVPIINENDSVSVEEFGFGDNDALAAYTANLWNADLLILMSNVDGVFDKDPGEDSSAKLIREVTDIDALVSKVDTSGKSSFGTGGMNSKIGAARKVAEYGTHMLLVNGKHDNVLQTIEDGGDIGTIFIAR